MADSVLTRILKWGIALASTWNTDIGAFAAGDQMLPHASTGWQMDRPTVLNKSAGLGRVQSSHLKPQSQPAPGFTIWPYEADHIFLLLLALYLGDDVVTGEGDPYTHTMEEQDESNFFCGVKFQEGDEVKGLASWMLTMLEIAPNSDGVIEFVASGLGDLLDTFTSTDLDSVTKTDIEDPYEFENTVFRINDQSAGALAGGDELELTNFKISFARPAQSIMASGNLFYSQPKQAEFPEPTLEIELEAKNTAAEGLFTDFEAETIQKCDFTFSGTSADREIILEFPAAKILSAQFEPDTVVTAKFTFQLQKATAAPTGMTGVNNTAIVKTSYATDVLT
jgi:hypothetical protein